MGSPTFNTPDGPPSCPRCGKPIRYQERHRHGGQWVHQRCPRPEPEPGTLPALLATAEEIVGDDPKTLPYCLAILALMNVDGDPARAAELSKLEPEFVTETLRPLVEQGVFKDGVWHVDHDVDLDDGQHCSIMLLIWTLCAMGTIRRVPKEADGTVGL